MAVTAIMALKPNVPTATSPMMTSSHTSLLKLIPEPRTYSANSSGQTNSTGLETLNTVKRSLTLQAVRNVMISTPSSMKFQKHFLHTRILRPVKLLHVSSVTNTLAIRISKHIYKSKSWEEQKCVYSSQLL